MEIMNNFFGGGKADTGARKQKGPLINNCTQYIAVQYSPGNPGDAENGMPLSSCR